MRKSLLFSILSIFFFVIFQFSISSVESQRYSLKTYVEREYYYYLFVPNSGNGNSISEINITNASSPKEVARHYTVPSGWNGDPSRTAIDGEGNAWIGNRDTNSLLKVGNYGGGNCVDKNGDGKIDTNYDKNGDGVVDSSEMVYDINSDECILAQVYLEENKLSSRSNDLGVRAVCVDKHDNVYAGMYGSRKLHYVSKNGTFLKTIDLSGIGCRPYGCVVDKHGLVWISCMHDNKVAKYNPKDDSLAQYPQDIPVYGISPTMSGDGLVFNAWESSKIRKIGLNGDVKFTVPGPYRGRGITVDRKDNIYAVGTYNNVLVKYDRTGSFVKQITTCNSPYGVGLDLRENIWVACDGCIDGYNSNLERISRICLGNLHYVYSDWTGSLIEFMRECNNNTICEEGETQENCPQDCRTFVSLNPAIVYPSQDVIVKVYFNDSRFNQTVDAKIDLFIDGQFWNTTYCPINGKKWREELSCNMEVCYGKHEGKPFRIVTYEGYGYIEAICKIPPSLKFGSHNLVAIPTIYSIATPLKQAI